MMVYKVIKSKKTPSGYSVWVNFRDGVHVKPLIKLISKYFVAVENANNPDAQKQMLLAADKWVSDYKKAEVEK